VRPGELAKISDVEVVKLSKSLHAGTIVQRLEQKLEPKQLMKI
jgi:hypothetical protein